MMKPFVALALGLALAVSGAAQASTFVAANNSGTTDLGAFGAGAYLITATGVSGLVGVPGNGGFDINPDGSLNQPVTAGGYGYFNPNGSSFDVNSGYGPGGSAIRLGALMGSFTPVLPLGNVGLGPAGLPNYFLIGYSLQVNLASAGHIYAQVNDTFYSNDGGGFTVNVSEVRTGVPEPATWALLILGFAGAGASLRRRRSLAAHA